MQFVARNKYIWFSPYKLRPLADVIRGKDVVRALDWLSVYKTQRSIPLKKTLESAVANAKDRENIEKADLFIKEIRVDQGPMRRYFKPGAMGRAMALCRRSSHLEIILEPKQSKKA